MEIQRLLFLYERNLYFGRCYIVANFKLNTYYTLTVKETQREFRNKFKMEGKHNYETIRDYNDYNAKVYFGVDPLDAEKIKLLSKTEKFDMIFIINATKGLDIKESFKVCSLLLKNEGELHMLFNSTQYEALKVGDAAAAAGMYFKENKKVDSEYCTGLSLKHIKAPEDAVIYIFKLTPKTTPSLNQPTVGSESASQPQGETSRHGLQLLLEDEKVAPESNLKKVRKVDLLGSEKVKEELVLDGNDIEQKSHVKNKDS